MASHESVGCSIVTNDPSSYQAVVFVVTGGELKFRVVPSNKVQVGTMLVTPPRRLIRPGRGRLHKRHNDLALIVRVASRLWLSTSFHCSSTFTSTPSSFVSIAHSHDSHA